MKRALLWSLGITALIAGVVVAVISRIDAGFIIKQIAALTERATGQALVCENPPEISFFPPGLSLGKARWGEISKGQGMAATVKSGTLVLELFPLFSGNMVIKEIRLDNPVFEMRGNAPASPEGEKTGTASASQGQHAASPPPPTSPPPDYPADLPVELERLVLRQGEILWDDGSNKRGHAKNINLSVENLRRREEAAVQCDFTFDVMQGKTDVLSGTLALDAKLRYEAATLIFRQSSVTFTPLKGRIPKDAGPVQLACEGSFALAKENLRLQTLRLTLPYNVKIQAELDLLVGKNLSVKGKVQSSVIPADKYAALLKKMDSLPAEDAKAAPARTAAPSAAGKKHPSGEKTSWPLVDMRISAAGVHYGKLGLNDIAV
ncbi:MAG: hypothetical protein LBC94_06175 [Desulfovibrio sp.]|jgi:AsmA protein|nr:hypothetical protein [Desulfovibrio sp.]